MCDANRVGKDLPKSKFRDPTFDLDTSFNACFERPTSISFDSVRAFPEKCSSKFTNATLDAFFATWSRIRVFVRNIHYVFGIYRMLTSSGQGERLKFFISSGTKYLMEEKP